MQVIDASWCNCKSHGCTAVCPAEVFPSGPLAIAVDFTVALQVGVEQWVGKGCKLWVRCIAACQCASYEATRCGVQAVPVTAPGCTPHCIGP